MLKPFAVLVLLGSVFCAGCADPTTAPVSTGTPGGDLTTLGSTRGSRFEPDFLVSLMDLTQAGIDLARLAPGRVVHPEVETFAQQVEINLSGDLSTLQSMLYTWYGIAYTPAPGGTGRLGSLTGADFEEAFLTKMVRHHDSTISLCRRGVARAEHTTLIALCMSIADARYAENSVMKSWNCTWYGNCR